MSVGRGLMRRFQPSQRVWSDRRKFCAPPLPEWSSLGFGYTPTKSMLRYNWTGNSWDSGKLTADFTLNIHGLSNVLHYGQGIFEGLKAFDCKDGIVRVFNSSANARRMQRGSARLAMPDIPPALFSEAVDRLVLDNIAYVPPYGTGGSLYIRPFLFGHGSKLGLGAAPEYAFCLISSPVGPYYKGGLEAIDALVIENYDRAAPRGVGSVKAAGNYAPDTLPSIEAKEKGFPVCLYLDAAEQAYVEEFSTSNFIGVTADGAIVTPSSPSILPSCTKAVVLEVARQHGMKVEERPVLFSEVATFKEVAACGTAVVLTPVKSITRGGAVTRFDSFNTISTLYEAITAIQTAESEDTMGITRPVGRRPDFLA
mmetsp:Transcript_33984/g.56233  ORF Transcript_33984/g.56233 Transcript_33984/m.56233 type:complete len:368 (+) Transcript_33984:51-1154(+)|eukprot:CAMPEP_0119313948 /NCGR_PEP_ID=MMETSP1333-20130426/31000_1 /TAXON_ID=418940 /ORGANISM="Scyphosphaera apsteinii, Strain RCC1455" /LENGTH=367 /DNA_ID=CAMNT_0007318939 /DNA_START=39 /DNA_END=1142 /DNA_ORIENTATION=+